MFLHTMHLMHTGPIKPMGVYTHDLKPPPSSTQQKFLFSFIASKASLNSTKVHWIPLAPPLWPPAESKPPSCSAETTTTGSQSPSSSSHPRASYIGPWSSLLWTASRASPQTYIKSKDLDGTVAHLLHCPPPPRFSLPFLNHTTLVFL